MKWSESWKRLLAARELSEDWEPVDFLYNFGDVEQAVAWFMLAGARFSRVDGCFVRDRADDISRAIHDFRTNGLSNPDVELLVNHLHMWDLVNRDSSFEVQYLVAEAVVTGWLRVLAEDFPTDSFEALIEFDETDGVQFSVASCSDPVAGGIRRLGTVPSSPDVDR